MNSPLRNFLAELLCRALTSPSKISDLLWLAGFCAVSEETKSAGIPFSLLREEVRRRGNRVRERGFTLPPFSFPGFLQVRRGEQIVPAGDLEGADGDFESFSVAWNPEFQPHIHSLRLQVEVYWNVLLALWPLERIETTDAARLLAVGAGLFNRGLFFEFHELLEGAWNGARGEKRLFLQGMIQIAVGYSRLQAGKVRGCLQLLREGSRKTSGFVPEFLGVELRDFLAGVEVCRAAVDSLGERAPREFDWSLVPRLRAGGAVTVNALLGGEGKIRDLGPCPRRTGRDCRG